MINKQDFLNAINQDIDIVKGDTLAFNFQLQGLEGVEPDTIIFSCAAHYYETPLFTVDYSDGVTLEGYDEVNDILTYSLRVAPVKTKDLDIGAYYYNLEADIGEDVITLMRGRFTLLFEVPRG